MATIQAIMREFTKFRKVFTKKSEHQKRKLRHPEAPHLIDLVEIVKNKDRSRTRYKLKPIVQEYCEKRNQTLPENQQLKVESVYRQVRHYI